VTRVVECLEHRAVEVDGAKLFFPEERPEKLTVQLRRHWAR